MIGIKENSWNRAILFFYFYTLYGWKYWYFIKIKHLSLFIRWIRCSCWYTEWGTLRVTMRSWYSWRRMHQLRCQYGLVRSGRVTTFFSVGVSADDESRRRRRDKTRRKGERKGEAVGWIHRRRKKRHHDERECDRRTWEMSAGKLEEGKKERDGWVKERRMGWDRTGDSLRQPRRQINMPGRAISNIRRSRRVGASCVRTRELRWWRSTAGRIRDRLARPVAIASADRKVNGRRSARIKDPLASPVRSKDENLWTSFEVHASGLGKTWVCPLSR